MWKWFHRRAVYRERQRVIVLIHARRRDAEERGDQANAVELAILEFALAINTEQ